MKDLNQVSSADTEICCKKFLFCYIVEKTLGGSVIQTALPGSLIPNKRHTSNRSDRPGVIGMRVEIVSPARSGAPRREKLLFGAIRREPPPIPLEAGTHQVGAGSIYPAYTSQAFLAPLRNALAGETIFSRLFGLFNVKANRCEYLRTKSYSGGTDGR